jgi:hypothetical protein
MDNLATVLSKVSKPWTTATLQQSLGNWHTKYNSHRTWQYNSNANQTKVYHADSQTTWNQHTMQRTTQVATFFHDTSTYY